MSFLFATKKPSKGVVEKYEGLGFSPDVIKKAWKACKGDEKKMMDQLFTLNQPPQLEPKPDPPTMKPAKVKMEPTFVQVPIEKKKSNKAPEKPIPRDVAVRASYEPLNAEQRIRPNGLPVGLKNVGNTCYFNSLFQTYFMSETFVSSVLRYDPKVSFVDDYLSVSTSKKGEDDIKRIRIEASIKLVQNLQRLFAKMIKSHKRYVDPTEVLESVVDDTGEKITVGNQRDITEYHLNFLSRIEDAFFYQDKFLEAREDSSESKPIRIKDLPESYVNSATLRNQLSSEALGNSGNSIIKNHFFGEMKQIMNFTQNDEPKTEEKDLVFGPVILDVMHKDFYTALEAYCNFTLDDYRTRNGEVTDAKGQIWITKPPELLFVQLNRVGYDKKTNMPVKSSKKFDFDKEIYLDRFSLDCRDEAYLINRRIGSLKTELNQKENTLQKLMSTFDGKSDILNMFDFMENFLQKQVNFEGSPSHVDQDPTIVGMIEESHKMQAAMDVIYAYKHHFQVKIAQLKESIVKIKETINKLWSKLNRRKYHLVSILIHDGDAESGHYYSFNRNIQKNTWNRFNDYYVTEEKEEVVLTEALGGFGNMSAYCLVYLADENIQEEINLNTTELKDLFAREETDVEVEKSYYKKLLTPILTQEVVADNIAFQDEVEEFQSTAYIKSVVESYKVHYNSLAKALQANSSIVPPPHLNTFGTFLKNDSYCDSALKWYIIDGILQNSQQSPQMKHLPKLSLRNLKDFPQLFLKAQHQFSSLASPYKVSSLTLTSSIENQLEIKLSEYTAEYPIIVYVRFILKAFRKGNWKDACHAIKLFLNMETNDKSYLSKLVRESTRVACLIMVLKAENYAIQGQFDECSEILQHISALVKGVLKPDEFHISQIRMIWFEFLNETKSSLPDDSRPVFKEHFRAFSQNTHSITELDKITENYASFELQRKLGKINGEDLYAWKDLGEKSCAAIIRKAFERFKYDFQIIIEFHTHLLTNKTLLNAVDRKRLGFQIF